MEYGDKIFKFGHFTFYKSKFTLIYREHEEVHLPLRSAESLLLLLENAGNIVEKETFLDQVWVDGDVDAGNLTVAITNLRKALRDTGENDEFIKTVPKRGYKFVRNVSVRNVRPAAELSLLELGEPIYYVKNANGEDVSAKFEDGVSNNHGNAKKSESRQKLRFWSSIGLVCAVLFATLLLGVYYKGEKLDSEEKVRFGVLPFKYIESDRINDADERAEVELLGYAVADNLTSRFGKLGEVETVSIISTSNFSRLDLSVKSQEIKELTDFVITGVYSRHGDSIDVTSKLIRTVDWQVLMERSFSIDVHDKSLVEVRNLIVSEIANSNGIDDFTRGIRLPPVRDELAQNAYITYLEGIDKMTKTDYEGAIQNFETVVALSPKTVIAWLFLSRAHIDFAYTEYGDVSHYKLAEKALLRAEEIEPTNLQVRIDQGYLLIVTQRWAEALRHYRAFLRDNPNNADAYFAVSQIYENIGPLSQAKYWLEKYLAKSPDSKRSAKVFIYSGEFDRFEYLMWNPGKSSYGQFVMGYLELNKGNENLAKDYFVRAYSFDNNAFVPQVGEAFRMCLNRDFDGAQPIFNEIESKLQKSTVMIPEGLFWLAQAYATCNENENALKSLQRATNGGFLLYEVFEKDKFLTGLKNDPKFDEIVADAKRKREAIMRAAAD
ncbi:MAG: winged helix-turn-helix domain-containing protein [Pyrinomonadaceae bacterium]